MTETDDAIGRMERLFAAQKAAAAGPDRPVTARRADLAALVRALAADRGALAAAVAADFGSRSEVETGITEIFYVVEAAKHARRRVARWARPSRTPVHPLLLPGRAFIEHRPKGVVGIIAPWNYPIQLSFLPVVDALAAGCRAMVKPSELAPRTAERLAATLGRVFPEDQVAVVTGGPEIGEAFARLPFGHLLFTGSAATGRKVAGAAARNLTPVTLELGGKSPAIVAEGYPIGAAARSIAWAKFLNAGQTCAAPDYVLAPAGTARALAEAILAETTRLYPGGAADPDYAAIISDRHVERLTAMLREAEDRGATVLREERNGSAGSPRKMPPTVVLGAPADCALMREEIFGPILPLIGVASLDEAVAFVAERDTPLALYAYAADRRRARDILAHTLSGGATVNQAFLHMSLRDAPFGGVGASGMGAYHGHAGFRTFSHQRTVFIARPRHPSQLLAPPYGRLHRRFLKWRLRS